MRKGLFNRCKGGFGAYLGLIWLMAVIVTCPAQAYDPLQTIQPAQEYLDLQVVDHKRQRTIPLRVYLPGSQTESPVIVFSHGLGGSRRGYAYLGRHWSSRGYVVVMLQHPGSDDHVWRDAPLGKQLKALLKAANPKNFRDRVKDVKAVLDVLSTWNEKKGHPLYRRMDLAKVGMAGHSFGALTTQAVGGQSFAGRKLFVDPRIKAALAMSPSLPRHNGAVRAGQAFSQVVIPWLLMTGTEDQSPLQRKVDPASRQAVFEALPPGSKYLLVLYGAKHATFSGRSLRHGNENGYEAGSFRRKILAVSTAFWDAYLRQDLPAKEWLEGEGVMEVLSPLDIWKKK